MLSDYLLVLIDGTGPVNEQQYRSGFENSFLHQISKNIGFPRVKYYEGPSVSGQDLIGRIVLPAMTHIRNFVKSKPGVPVLLGGYSRGGAGVMEIAKRLSADPIPIKDMMLLDPVSKLDGCPGGVTSNVGRVFAMFRDQTCVHVSPWITTDEQVSRWDKAAVISFGWRDKDRYARRFMENADTSLIYGNSITKRWVNGDGVIPQASHGALGGTPWPERDADRAAVGAVATRLNQWLSLSGVGTSVVNKIPFLDSKTDPVLLKDARFNDFAYHENARRARMPLRTGESRWPQVTRDDPMWLRVKDTYRTPDEV